MSAGHQDRSFPVDKWEKVITYILEDDLEMQIALFSSEKEKNQAKLIKNIFKERTEKPLTTKELAKLIQDIEIKSLNNNN